MSVTVDAVVIGGGIEGLANAYYLSRQGLSVILVEKGDLVAGTSSRCDGNNYISDSAPGEITQLMKLAVYEMKRVVTTELDYDVDWIQNGMLLLAENELQMEQARKQMREKLEDGVLVKELDSKELHDAEPNLAPDICGALEFTEGGSLSPILLGFALGEMIKKQGGKLWRFTEVIGFGKNEDGSVGKVITTNGEIFTKNVVLAAGVWSPELGRKIGLEIPVFKMKGELLVAESDVRISNRFVSEIGYNFVRNEETDSNTMDEVRKKYGIGFLTEPTGAKNSLVGFSKYPGDTFVPNVMVTRAIAKRAIRFYPMIAEVNIIRTYSGLRPWTPDHEPIVSKTDIPGFYLCTGHCGNGITYGPICAKFISQWILGKTPEFNMNRLSLNRFEKQGGV